MTHRDITPYQSHSHTHSPLFLIHHYCSFSSHLLFPPLSVFLSLPDSYFSPIPLSFSRTPPAVYYSLIFFHSLPLPLSPSFFSLLQCRQLAECQGMLISAGRLGPANMAKSKKKREKKEKGGRHREKEMTDGEKYTVPLQTGQCQKDTARGRERDLIWLPTWWRGENRNVLKKDKGMEL